MKLQMTGDWNKAGIHLRNIHVKMNPMFTAKFYEDGQMVLEKMKNHIYNQDLNWTPLAESTVVKKGSNEVYIQEGYLVEGLVCRRIKSGITGSTIYVGASPWKTHPNGTKMTDLMVWLEYGTDKIPPRPLIRPTFEEVKDLLQDGWKDLFESIVKGES